MNRFSLLGTHLLQRADSASFGSSEWNRLSGQIFCIIVWCGRTGRAAAMAHDIGKYSSAFQKRLRGNRFGSTTPQQELLSVGN